MDEYDLSEFEDEMLFSENGQQTIQERIAELKAEESVVDSTYAEHQKLLKDAIAFVHFDAPSAKSNMVEALVHRDDLDQIDRGQYIHIHCIKDHKEYTGRIVEGPFFDPDALKRAATIADAWMGSGGSSNAEFARSVPIMRQNLEKAGRDPKKFPISKRVFLSVHERADVARAECHHWFTTVYHNPNGADASGVHGTPEQVRARLEELVAHGADHLLLNPVCRHAEQVEALAAIVGLS